VTLFTRWIRFSAGGTYGTLLQLFALMLLGKWLPLTWATTFAVELAVLHNFIWHELYTWRDRHVRGLPALLGRLMRFQMSNGVISIGGNVVLTSLLHEHFGIPAVIANVMAIGLCGAFNFVASEWLVFASAPKRYPEDRETMFV
jgi:putative flippase GtrA